MDTVNITTHKTTQVRPQKGGDVRQNFPLDAHANGQWAKTIGGRKYFFGAWNAPSSTEAEYLRKKEYLQAGVKPPPKEIEGFGIRDLANRLLTFKEQPVQTEELSPRPFRDDHRHCKNIVEHFGVSPREGVSLRGHSTLVDAHRAKKTFSHSQKKFNSSTRSFRRG